MSQLLSLLGNNHGFNSQYTAATAQNKSADDYHALMAQLSQGSAADQARAQQMAQNLPSYTAVPAAPLGQAARGGLMGLPG